MTERQDIFDKVNGLLEDSGYPVEIKDISDLEDFLNEVENQDMEEYEVIEKLYDELMEESEYEIE